MAERIGGLIALKVAGAQVLAKGNFSYSAGTPKRESVMGADGFHGYKESPQPCYIEGEISIDSTTDVGSILGATGITITLELPGKTLTLSEAFYAGDGKAETEEGKLAVRFEGKRMDGV